jgi:ribosomal protein S26
MVVVVVVSVLESPVVASCPKGRARSSIYRMGERVMFCVQETIIISILKCRSRNVKRETEGKKAR